MSDDVESTYREQAAERRYHFSEFEWLGRQDPAFERARLEMVRQTYLRPDAALHPKYKELIAAAILAFRGYPSVEHHIRRALREGATVAEVIEAFEMASVPGGQATLHYALRFLPRIVAEEGLGDGP